jgi:hypothetical protein
VMHTSIDIDRLRAVISDQMCRLSRGHAGGVR